MPVILESSTAAKTVTAGSIIERAYRILGDLGAGESMTDYQATVGLDALNAMLDSFSIERLMIYVIKQESLTWPASTSSRTIGSSGDFDTVRPVKIEAGTYFRDSNNIDYPVNIIANRSVYDDISDKTIESSYPELLFYETTSTLGTIYLYPVPNQSLTLKLNSWQALTEFNNIASTFTFPPGYRRMLAFNLAVELEGETGLLAPPAAHRIASSSRTTVKQHNHKPILAQTETAYVLHGGRRPDIVAGK